MGTIAATTSDEEETNDESDRAALLQNQINHDGISFRTDQWHQPILQSCLEVYVSAELADENQFDIVEKVEMVSGRRCDAHC